MTSRVFCFRHTERVVGDPDQNPTPLGELLAYGMGMFVRQRYSPDMKQYVCSPQVRAVSTAVLFTGGLRGILGYYPPLPLILREHMLNDNFTDPRPTVQSALAEAKERAKQSTRTHEEEFFSFPEGLDVLHTRGAEMVDVVEKLSQTSADQLLIGHSPSLEAGCLLLKRMLDGTTPFNLASIGGQLNTMEGFMVAFDEPGLINRVELIRRPSHLVTLSTLDCDVL
ncbi:MAG: histidine phosphatase family protein [Candidatus Doudnabacteria bacterium]|nr:histidine phosphatase family protein [Candidatus Doudnabacteria bacterium]